MNRPRLLDLFCGAGGAAMGYHRAGFDVTGVDIAPQPRYPFPFVQADAMTYPLDGYDAIHASPPCQDHSVASSGRVNGTGWMLLATRDRLAQAAVPWVIENVPGAPMRADYKLCGCMFGLDEIERERWFEVGAWSPSYELRSGCYHPKPIISVTGHGRCRTMRTTGLKADWARAMGIDWMTRDGLAQAIPPAYTEYIGGQLLREFPAREPARRGTVGG